MMVYKFNSTSKINLFLDIKGRDDKDGYHFLESLFLEIPFGDEITMTKSDKDSVAFLNADIGTDNTVKKSLDLFKEKYNITDTYKVEIKKNVPHGAGLGGGSGDAGAVLKKLCSIYNVNPLDCIDIARQVGCDVPFFLYGGAAYVEGKGEKITPLQCRADFDIMLVYPEIFISTKAAFEALSRDKCFNNRNLDIENISKKDLLSIDTVQNIVYNIFDDKLKSISQELLSRKNEISNLAKPDLCFMTGSGSCFVLLFGNKISMMTAKKVIEQLESSRMYIISN